MLLNVVPRLVVVVEFQFDKCGQSEQLAMFWLLPYQVPVPIAKATTG